MQHTRADSGAAADPVRELLPERPPTSPMFWIASAAMLLLLLTFYLIVAGARRSARTEDRGDGLAEVLLREGCAIAPIDWDCEWQRQHLLARLFAAAAASGVFAGDLELLPNRGGDAITFANKHYCIELRRSPPEDDTAAGGDDALEAMSWPLETVSPAHTVFFYPEDAAPAYSRNLQSAYVDSDPERRPRPGQAHRRDDGKLRLWDYRGLDDERWLLRDRPQLQARQ